jgi:uncharacterized membrane protein
VEANIGTWQRVGSVAGGLALLYAGNRRPRWKAMTQTTGVGLVMRGVSGFCPVTAVAKSRAGNDDTRKRLGGSRGVHVHEVVTIDRPRAEVFGFWRQLSNLPRFMRHLERIDMLDGGRSHWVVAGPLGTHVEWDAEVINEVEHSLIAWRSLPGSEVASAGSVHFRDVPGGATEVSVHLQYSPPAGKVGAWFASLFGEEPSQQIHDDLRRLGWYLETGEVAGAHRH